MSRARSESGQVTAFVASFALALFLLAGLVIDGGLALASKRRAVSEADAAARAGAQALAVDEFRASGTTLVDPERAVAAASAHLAATGESGEVDIVGDRVVVTVRISRPMLILGLGGLHNLTVTGTGEARLVHGVGGPES